MNLPSEYSSKLLHTPIVACRAPENTPEWLRARNVGIGSSDAASVLGVPGAFSTPLQVWADKRGHQREYSVRTLELFRWGHIMEPVIAGALAEEGFDMHEEPATLAHPEYDWMRANIDRWCISTDRAGPGVAELKNAGAYQAKNWEDKPPLIYVVQHQHQLAVTGAEWGVIAALIGGNSFVYHIVERNERFIRSMIYREQVFWRQVIDGDMPEPKPTDNRFLNQFISEDEQEGIFSLPEEAAELDIEIRQAKADIKEAKGRLDKAEAALKSIIGEAPGGHLPDGSTYVWQTVERDGYTVNPTKYRELRRSK